MVNSYREDICCVILSLGKRYEKLANVAVKSFSKHNPNIKVYLINDNNYHEYESSKTPAPVGITKYKLCLEIAEKFSYKKVINLGADTITCAYLSEFIENNQDDILATLDYPYTLNSGGIVTPPGDSHVNADVVCFNSLEAIRDIVEASKKHHSYFEQGGLNEIIWTSQKYKTKIVDGPYKDSSVVYNVRAKGNICAAPNTKPWSTYTLKYKVNDNKLYTYDDKQIKVFHYCEGLGTLNDTTFNELLNNWIFDWFNQETKDFFKNYCDTGNYFEGKYEV